MASSRTFHRKVRCGQRSVGLCFTEVGEPRRPWLPASWGPGGHRWQERPAIQMSQGLAGRSLRGGAPERPARQAQLGKQCWVCRGALGQGPARPCPLCLVKGSGGGAAPHPPCWPLSAGLCSASGAPIPVSGRLGSGWCVWLALAGELGGGPESRQTPGPPWPGPRPMGTSGLSPLLPRPHPGTGPFRPSWAWLLSSLPA